MKWHSIKFKISIFYTLLLGIAIIIYNVFLYFSLSYSLYNELDAELIKKTQAITQIIQTYSDTLIKQKDTAFIPFKKAIGLDTPTSSLKLIKYIDTQWQKKLDKLSIQQDFICFWDTQKNLIISSKNLSQKLIALFTPQLTNHLTFKTISIKRKKLRIICYTFEYQNKHYLLQIATSLKPVMDTLSTRSVYIIYSIPIFLFITIFIGRSFASRILKPVVDVTQAATIITHKDLSARLPEKQQDDEMTCLVTAFNSMISRLEKSFNHIGEFSSNVAHELKTPLAIIQGECEVTLRKDRTKLEYQRVLTITLEEIRRMRKTIDDLLLLSKLEYHPEDFKFEKIDFIKFIKDIYEQTKLLVKKRELTTELIINEKITALPISVDILSLRRLFFNLINNSLKFTPKKGTVKFHIFNNNNQIAVSITDTGVGIPETELPKIFDRFFHINRNTENKEPGNGLGLNIANSIAKIHNGKISVESTLGQGSIFTVYLPI